MGLRLDGLPTVGFIVKIGSIKQNVDPSIALCRSQPIAVSGRIILPALSLRCRVLGCLLGTRNCNSNHHVFGVPSPRLIC
jgi:hypothetical protein